MTTASASTPTREQTSAAPPPCLLDVLQATKGTHLFSAAQRIGLLLPWPTAGPDGGL